MYNDEMVSINDASNKLHISYVTLIKRLDNIDYPITDKGIKKNYLESILLQKEQTISICDLIIDYYKSIKNKIITNYFMNKLIVYAVGYRLWGARYIEHPVFQLESYSNNIIYIYKEDVEIIKSNLYELITLHSVSNNEKFKFLISETVLRNYSETVILLKKFFDNNYKKDILGIVEICNYFRYILKKEFAEYDNKEMLNIFKNADKDLSGPGKSMLVKFYTFAKEHSSCHSDVIVHYDKHKADLNKDISPYDMNTYFSIAYMVMNKDYWDEHNMIKKAVEKEMNAKIWLYHLMHFMCAWRSIDIRRKLPRFNISDNPHNVLKKVAENCYSQDYYIMIAEMIGYKFDYDGKVKKPQKTEKHENVSILRFAIPESIKPIFGMVALLCEAHNQINGKTGSLCEIRSLELREEVSFFDEPYEKILGGHTFSNRKANKNYMNILSGKSEETGVDGYLLATYARSHMGGIDNIPEVTSRYLKAKMDGYSSDEIVRCLMERGVCSFVPYLLCLAMDNEQFTKKRIEDQTDKIHKLKLSPAQIENLLEIDDKLFEISKRKVKEIIKLADNHNVKNIIQIIIENIIDGECYGKDENVFCLAKACNNECVQVQRTTCIGCGYEMYLKSVLIELSQEIFNHESKLNNAITEGEKIKRTLILKERLYPASYEILSAIKYIYGEDIANYKKILERGYNYAIDSDI